MSRLFAKLGANSRSKAVERARARALGLLAPKPRQLSARQAGVGSRLAEPSTSLFTATGGQMVLRVLEPKLGTRPRVWYRNLDRIDLCFIGGTVSRTSDGVVEQLEETITAKLIR